MKIKVYIRVETVEVLLAKKNEDLEWFANQMSMSTWHAREILKGKAPLTPDSRKRVMKIFSGMAIQRGRPSWDQIFKVEEVS